MSRERSIHTRLSSPIGNRHIELAGARAPFRWFAGRVRSLVGAALLAGLYLAVATACGGASPAAAAARMTDEQIVEDLSGLMSRLAAKDKFSGAVLLAKGDKVLFARAYGFANHAFNAKNRVDTKFCLASMGKMFTGVAILQLVQQGKLSLDDTVLGILPDYPDQDIAAKITVHQLLTHTSGLGNFHNEPFRESSRAKYRTIAAHLPLFAGEPLKFEPGAKWAYSNSGFIVLGLIIEKVSGESYYDYVRKHIFEPAGMINTDNYNVDDDVPNLALGYTTTGDDFEPLPANAGRRTNILLHAARGSSAGGAYSTVEDLLRFSRALQENRLLDKKHTDLDLTGKVAMGREEGKYGYGMIEVEVDGARIVGHRGVFAGVSSVLEMYPSLGYTVVVLSNYDRAAGDVNQRLRFSLTGNRVPGVARLSAEALSAFAGQYATGRQRETSDGDPIGPVPRPIDVSVEQGALSVTLPGKRADTFLPLSAHEFFDDGNPRVRLYFKEDERARTTRLTITGVERKPIEAIRQ